MSSLFVLIVLTLSLSHHTHTHSLSLHVNILTVPSLTIFHHNVRSRRSPALTKLQGLFECKVEKQMVVCKDTPIEMVVVAERFSAVLLLCGGHVYVVHIPSFAIRARLPGESQMGGTTEATLHALGELMGMAGDRSRVISFCTAQEGEKLRICCQVRGSLHFYDLSGGKTASLAPYASLPLLEQHQGQLMTWTGRRLFLGGPQEYSVHDPSLAAPPGQQPPHISYQTLFPLNGGRPSLLPLPTEVLLVSGIVGVFVDHMGAITRSSITWSKPPRSLAYCKPFILALQEDQIEIHNAFDQQLVQVVRSSQVSPLLLLYYTEEESSCKRCVDSRARERECVCAA